ncbi:MAG: sugar transferase [Planctomycetaceae bacterium]|jgi:lipopolysaccharide/colanic/teichoic acid biosynthesis glycosyltransferase|nr:sugar transferase [Planctomycetaceae bacterium]
MTSIQETLAPVFPTQTYMETFSHSAYRSFLCPKPHVSSYFRYKGLVDRFVAALLLIPALPIIGILALCIKLTSKGTCIYAQERLGKNGRRFTMYKLRSMVVDAEKSTGAVWASQNDARVTLIGKFLRKFHLDELPQLLNVLRGEMALVGPRPEREEFVKILSREIDGYSHRLLVVPGVTGFAQLNLPPDLEVADVRRKISLDFEYIENASFWFDFVLILGTLGRFTKFLGTIHLKFLGIYRKVNDSPWAPYVGASSDVLPNRTMALSQLFDIVAADRSEKISPAAT